MSTKTNRRIYMPFLSKSPLIAAVFTVTLAATATLALVSSAWAHDTGNWVDGNSTLCTVACAAANRGPPVTSGHYGNTQQHYYVCRVHPAVTNAARRRRPGFNIVMSSNRCRIEGFYSVADYQCLCQ